jgi:Na+-translocating ferredoxin:NAD+ oxidoreductase RnfG subunit
MITPALVITLFIAVPAVFIALVAVSIVATAHRQNRAQRQCWEAMRRIVLESQSADSDDREQCAAQQVKIAGCHRDAIELGSGIRREEGGSSLAESECRVLS